MAYSNEHHRAVLAIYSECGRNASEACRRLAKLDIFPNTGPSLNYVKKQWKAENLPLLLRGGKQTSFNHQRKDNRRAALSDFEQLDVLVNFYQYGGNISSASKNGKYGRTTYSRHWERYKEYLEQSKFSLCEKIINDYNHFEPREPTLNELDQICNYLCLIEEDMVVR